MASTYSPSLRLELMATGDQSGTWGDTTNTNLGTLLEQAIAGVLSVAEGDATLTLTALDGASDQSRNMVIELTGAMTAGRNVVVPTAEKLYLIKNSTTGGFAVTVKTAAGTGVTVPATTARWVYCDGTNVVDGQSGSWAPSANDAQALGLSATAWSDLFLASGGVIGWNAGNFTLTHSAGLLTANGTIASTAASAGFVGFRAISTEAGAAAGPIIELYRDSATPAASDIIGQLLFNGEDSAGNTQEYGSIQAVIADPTSTSEDSTLDFYVPVAGTRTLVASFGPGITATAPILADDSASTTVPVISFSDDTNTGFTHPAADTLAVVVGGSEVSRLTSTGTLVGKTSFAIASAGIELQASGALLATRSAGIPQQINRLTDDGTLVNFLQDTTIEGAISVSGTTVTYGSFTGVHWSQLADGGKPDLLPGTIVETLDEMCSWLVLEYTDHLGNPQRSEDVPNGVKDGDTVSFTYQVAVPFTVEVPPIKKGGVVKTEVREELRSFTVTALVKTQPKDYLPRFKVSDTAGSRSAYGIFLAWDNDYSQTNDAHIVALGTLYVRMPKGSEVPARGSLIESNGDGCGRVQADDLMRSSTVAKVTAATVLWTYAEDGSYLVPCTVHCG